MEMRIEYLRNKTIGFFHSSWKRYKSILKSVDNKSPLNFELSQHPFKVALFTSFLISIIINLNYGLLNTAFKDLYKNEIYGYMFWQKGFSVYNYYPDKLGAPASFIGNNIWTSRIYEKPSIGLIFNALLVGPYYFIPNHGFIHHFMVISYLLFHHLSVYYFWKLMKDINKSSIAGITIIIFYHITGVHWALNGQFEGFVSFLLVFSFYLRKKGHPLSYLFYGLSVAAKIYPVFFLPIFLFIGNKLPKKKQILYLLFGGSISFSVFIAPVFYSDYIIHSLPGHYTQLGTGDLGVTTEIMNIWHWKGYVTYNPLLIFLFVFAMYIGTYLGIKFIKERYYASFLSLLAIYLYFTFSVWVMYWYVLWIYPAAVVLTQNTKLQNLSQKWVFGYLMIGIPPFYDFYLFIRVLIFGT